jgi:tRNA(fMet)-specific endonuclease VapC
MKRFILDTAMAALHLARKRGVFERSAAEVASGNRVGIAAPVLAELAFQAEWSPQRDRHILRLCQAPDAWKLWLVDTAAAFEYGRLAIELKTIGRPIRQNGIMIAAATRMFDGYVRARAAARRAPGSASASSRDIGLIPFLSVAVLKDESGVENAGAGGGDEQGLAQADFVEQLGGDGERQNHESHELEHSADPTTRHGRFKAVSRCLI